MAKKKRNAPKVVVKKPEPLFPVSEQCPMQICLNRKQPYHACPFSVEIQGNSDPVCECCKECTWKCYMEV